MIQRKLVDILIFGTGAVGSTLGWRLAQHPHTRLSVVCRSNYDTVKRYGFFMNTKLWGNGTFRPHRVVRSTEEVSGVTFDYVVCANKITSTDSSATIKELAHILSPNTTLVSAQNGVGVESPLAHTFRGHNILSAICYVSCVQPTAGIIHQVSHIRPHAFHIGHYATSPWEDPMIATRKLADFVSLDTSFKQIDDVHAERWAKQVFNGAWNPMTALTGLETHPLIASPYLGMVRQLAQETFKVGLALGVPLHEHLPEKTIEFARNNPSMAPSMLQDARAKRLMEVDSLCGNIIRQAEQVGVPVPTVRIVYHALQEMNRQMEGLLSPQIPPTEYQSAHLTPLVRKPATTRGNIVQEQCGEAKPHSAC